MGFWAQHWVEILFGLIAAGSLGICRYFAGQVKNYKKLLEQQEDEHMIAIINQRLVPIKQELEELKEMITGAIHDEEELKAQLVGSYRFRLMQLCRIYIRQTYLTQEQYDQLSEFFKIYEVLGGNGQAKALYERAIELPIVEAAPTPQDIMRGK